MRVSVIILYNYPLSLRICDNQQCFIFNLLQDDSRISETLVFDLKNPLALERQSRRCRAPKTSQHAASSWWTMWRRIGNEPTAP